ncbi:small ribosomal subunit protein uS12-like [Silene latifolia]|uniref:small ribosomal subunit protein uS12-like n=1 Tax=Silene latifolia TaxID=37657 RepID=UPI003D7808E0
MKDFIEGVFSSVLAVLPSIYSRQACGMGAAHRLKSHRRNRRCAGKQYKKSHQGNEWKKPFSGSSHARGIVLEKIGIEVKQPNSAIRKCARVEPIKNRQKMVAFVSNYGCLNFIEENFVVTKSALKSSEHLKSSVGIDWNFNGWGGAADGCYRDWSRDVLVAKKAGFVPRSTLNNKIRFFRRLGEATGTATAMCSYFISSSCNFSVSYYLVKLRFF